VRTFLLVGFIREIGNRRSSRNIRVELSDLHGAASSFRFSKTARMGYEITEADHPSSHSVFR
jgi:hypothetical protein